MTIITESPREAALLRQIAELENKKAAADAAVARADERLGYTSGLFALGEAKGSDVEARKRDYDQAEGLADAAESALFILRARLERERENAPKIEQQRQALSNVKKSAEHHVQKVQGALAALRDAVDGWQATERAYAAAGRALSALDPDVVPDPLPRLAASVDADPALLGALAPQRIREAIAVLENREQYVRATQELMSQGRHAQAAQAQQPVNDALMVLMPFR